jgi:hypothetical protein
MLNLRPGRLKWGESVSLRRFQNCNPLETDHFHHHAVEDEPESINPDFQSWDVAAAGKIRAVGEFLFIL